MKILVKTEKGTLGAYRIEENEANGIAVGCVKKMQNGTSVIKSVAALVQEEGKLKLFIHDNQISDNDIVIIHI